MKVVFLRTFSCILQAKLWDWKDKRNKIKLKEDLLFFIILERFVLMSPCRFNKVSHCALTRTKAWMLKNLTSRSSKPKYSGNFLEWTSLNGNENVSTVCSVTTVRNIKAVRRGSKFSDMKDSQRAKQWTKFHRNEITADSDFKRRAQLLLAYKADKKRCCISQSVSLRALLETSCLPPSASEPQLGGISRPVTTKHYNINNRLYNLLLHLIGEMCFSE